jgi:hypothetical protein
MIEQIKAYRNASPFRPFEIVLDDGREIVIRRPEYLGRFPSDDRIFFSTPKDTTETVEVSHVKKVRPVASGRKRRRGSGMGRRHDR